MEQLDIRELKNTSPGNDPASGLDIRTFSRPSVQPEGFGARGDANLYNYTPSKYDVGGVYTHELNNLDDIRSRYQGTLDSLGRSVVNFAGKTAINVIGGIAGSIYGVGAAMASGDIKSIWDNSLTNVLDTASEAVGDYFKVYKSDDYNNSSLIGRMFLHPIQFTDEFMDTLSFTAGAVVTELATAGMASGLVVPRALKYLKALDKGSDAVAVGKSMERSTAGILSRLGDAGTLSRQLATGAAWEASVEARHGATELRSKMISDWLEENPGYDIESMPEDIKADIDQRVTDAGLFTFITNMALVGSSNLIQFPKIFGANYNTSKRAVKDYSNRIGFDESNKFIDKATNALSREEKIRRNILTAIKNPVMEGIVEEGGQSVISKTALDYFDRKNDLDAGSKVDEFLKSFGKAFAETYTTGEGWYEIGMGMLIGSMGAPGRGILSVFGKDTKLGKEGFNEDGTRREFWTGGIAGAFQERAEEDREVAKLVEELNNQPDLMTAMKSNYDFLVRTASYQRDMDAALENGDVFGYENARDNMLFSYIQSRMQAGIGNTLDDTVDDLNKISAELLYKELRGEEALNEATQEEINEFKRKQVEYLKNKINSVRFATRTVDNALQNIHEDLREELIYNLSMAGFMDQRENEINKKLSELSNGTIFSKLPVNIKEVEDYTIGAHIKDLKKQLDELEKDSPEYNELLEEIGYYINVANNPKTKDLSTQEVFMLNTFKEAHPLEYAANRDEVIDLIKDSKKVRARRQNLINSYNILFTEKGQKAFQEYLAEQQRLLQEAADKERARLAKEEEEKAVKDRQKEIKEKADKLDDKTKEVSDKESDNKVDETEEPTENDVVPETTQAEQTEGNQEETPDVPQDNTEDTPQDDIVEDDGSTDPLPSDDKLTKDEELVNEEQKYNEEKEEIRDLSDDGNIEQPPVEVTSSEVFNIFDIDDQRTVGPTIISLNIEYIERKDGSIRDVINDSGNLEINSNFDGRLQDPKQFKEGDVVDITIPTYKQMMDSGMRKDYTLSEYNSDMEDVGKMPVAFLDNTGKIIGYLPTVDNIAKRVAPKFKQNALLDINRVRSIIKENNHKNISFKITDKTAGVPMLSNNFKPLYDALGDGKRMSRDVKLAIYKEGTLMTGQATPFTGKIKKPKDTGKYFSEGVVYSVVPSANDGEYYAIPMQVNNISTDSANTVVQLLRLFLAKPENKHHKNLIENREAIAHEADLSTLNGLMKSISNILYVNNKNTSGKYRFELDLKKRTLRIGVKKSDKFNLDSLLTDQNEIDRLVEALTNRYYAVRLNEFGNSIPAFSVKDGKVNVEYTNYYDYLHNNKIVVSRLQPETIPNSTNKYFTAQSVISISEPIVGGKINTTKTGGSNEPGSTKKYSPVAKAKSGSKFKNPLGARIPKPPTNDNDILEDFAIVNVKTISDSEFIEYSFHSVNVMLKNIDKIKSWERNKAIDQNTLWNKIQELGVPKEQLELIKNSEGNTVEEKLLDFTNQYSYTVEINTAKEPKNYDNIAQGFQEVFDYNNEQYFYDEWDGYFKEGVKITKKEFEEAKQKSVSDKPTQYYSNLTVPGGTNYTENEIATPAITPSIKGHAQFATDNGIGWFRSDEQTLNQKIIKEEIWDRDSQTGERTYLIQEGEKEIGETTKTRRILEVQSDLFQKWRNNFEFNGDSYSSNEHPPHGTYYFKSGDPITKKEFLEAWNVFLNTYLDSADAFTKLLQKDNNWVTFFIKSIIQDSAKKGYEKVLFPKGDTAAKIEGHQTLEEFKKQKEKDIKKLEDGNKTMVEEIEEIQNSTIEDYVKKNPRLGTYEVLKFKRFRQRGEPLGDYVKVGIKTKEEAIKIFNKNLRESIEIYQSYLEANNRNIKTYKQELADVESGQTQLSSIAKFYETTITNVLKKNGYNPVEITDEYGNTWNEVAIRDTNLSAIDVEALNLMNKCK